MSWRWCHTPSFTSISMFGGIKRGIISMKANDPHLSNLISEEKDLIASIKQSHESNAAAAKYLSLWGEGEHTDLKDITNHYLAMSNEFNLIITEWEYAQMEFREKLKDIRTHSDNIATLRQKVKNISDKISKAVKAGKPTDELDFEKRANEAQLKNEIANFEHTKRVYLHDGMISQFNGLKKFALKTSEYASYGAHLAHQIPKFTVTPGQELPDFKGIN